MRASVRTYDSGYAAFCRMQAPVIVRLNGVRAHDVITADEERGYIMRFRRNPDGTLTLNARRTYAKQEIVRGVVEIERQP